MSNKSGTSEQVISLPQGGGAMQGIGEKFAADLFTGTGNVTVPIALPPGRNGFQPGLDLTYSTGNGNGPFGLGWGLSLPCVSRQSSHGVPAYRDDDSDPGRRDTFVLSGADDLVPIDEQTSGISRYRPRTEGLFARVERHRHRLPGYWTVRTRDGLISTFGDDPTDAQAYAPGWAPAGSSALLVAPGEASRVFAWNLTLTKDPFGSRIEYVYRRSTTDRADEAHGHQSDQPLLSQIRYADVIDPDDRLHFLITVTFEYEVRPDRFSEYRPGFEVRTMERCASIRIETHFDRTRAVRRYRFSYENESAANGVSMLKAIDISGYDDDAAETSDLPSLVFDYTAFTPSSRVFKPVVGIDLPAQSLARADVEVADLNGNGLPDIIQMNGAVRCWRNLGHGRYDRPQPMRDSPPVALADPGVQLLDANGDGRVDLLMIDSRQAGYFPLDASGDWDRAGFRFYRQTPTIDFDDPEVKLVDLVGDGSTDVIRSGRRLECFFNDRDPRRAWTSTALVERQGLAASPDVSFADPRVKWGDMSGDNLQDILLLHNGGVVYWPNLGHGRWGHQVRMDNSPRFSDTGYGIGYDPRRLLVGDVDGDGLADLVYVGDSQVTVWINRSGSAWSDPITVRGTPTVTDLDAVRLLDLLGTGTAGVLWTADADSSHRPRMFFLDFTGGVKPYLLREMDNQVGSLTRVHYRPSTSFYLEDQPDPRTRWRGSLPMPVHLLAQVEVIDELSGGKLTTEYRYHHGHWDGAEREFRGFGIVDQVDTESFDRYNANGLHGGAAFERVDDDPAVGRERARFFSAPTLTRTWFHQGAVGLESDEWTEPDLLAGHWSGDPAVLNHTKHVNRLLSGVSGPDSAITQRNRRDALRTLSGRILRTELYALDPSRGDLQPGGRPYTVSEQAYEFVEVAPPDAASRRSRVFFPRLTAQRTTQWERGDDPQTQFTFIEDYDAYGQPRVTSVIACPRGWRSVADRPEDGYLATRVRTDFAVRDDAEHFLVDRVRRATAYEYARDSTAGKTVFEVRAVRAGDPSLMCFAQVVNAFDGFDQLADHGRVGNFGAVTTTETLALTDRVLDDAYGAHHPPYLAPGAPAWPPEYPPAFRQRIDGLPGHAGYHHRDGTAAAHHNPGYFVRTARRYDFQDDPLHARGLVIAEYDPLGNADTIEYAFRFLPVSVTDAAGLVTTVSYDYRFLRPALIRDPNGNRTAVTFTSAGLPASIAVLGPERERRGDGLHPGTRYEYNFKAFADSPKGNRQPIYVRTIRRQEHSWDIVATENESRRQQGRTELNETEIGALFSPNELRDHSERFIEVRDYSDGLGRLLQTRAQGEEDRFGEAVFGGNLVPADPADATGTAAPLTGRSNRGADAPNVVVSGWQTYDNKGREVEKFEPFFDTGWSYSPPSTAYLGGAHRSQVFRDALGRAIRTQNPDGSVHHVIYGWPLDQVTFDPKRLVASPWEVYAYDANDNAGRTHHNDPQGTRSAHHWDTPASSVIDAFGRTTTAVERNRVRLANGTWSQIQEYRTASTFDVRGNRLTVRDQLGRVAFASSYDLADRALSSMSIDGGTRMAVFDAAGNLIEERDAKGALQLATYDALNRVTGLWARDSAGGAVTMRQRLVYGDDAAAELTRDEARTRNLLGRLYRHYDEAGLLELPRYDFKGNQVARIRRTVRDDAIANGWVANWAAQNAGDVLEPAEGAYDTMSGYDALNRVTHMSYPAGAAVVRPIYNRGGALERMELDGEPLVERIAYNSKGQRVLVVYGNGIMTRYAYESKTFRLARQRTERCFAPGPLQYRAAPGQTPVQRRRNILQDLVYSYDMSGNPTGISDRTPGSGSPGAMDRLDRTFVYDALYRLVRANGRETDEQPPRPWDASPRSSDLTRTRLYTQTYSYDPAGNLLSVTHTGRATRHFGMAGFAPRAWRDKVLELSAGGQPDWGTEGNRLTNVGTPEQGRTHSLDACGNLALEGISRHFVWNYADQLIGFVIRPTPSSPPSVEERYLYDAGGARVKKWTRRSGGGPGDSEVYVDEVFEHHRWRETGRPGLRENVVVHVMDGPIRVATRRRGQVHPDDRGPDVQYHLADHLSSSSLVVGGADAGGRDFVNREEYYPFGETSFGSFGMKRYRFTGKRRDALTGFYYHGARCYAPWLHRWASCDPIGPREDLNLYVYALNNPLVYTDPDGMQTRSTVDGPLHTTTTMSRTEEQVCAGTAESCTTTSVTRSWTRVIHNVETGEVLVDSYSETIYANHTVPVIQAESPSTSAAPDPVLAGPSDSSGWSTWDIVKEAFRQLPEMMTKSSEERAAAIDQAFRNSGQSEEQAALNTNTVMGTAQGVGGLVASAVTVGLVKLATPKTHVVYGGFDKTTGRPVYVGRASGVGTLEKVVAGRILKGHKLKGNPNVTTKPLMVLPSKNAAHGAEGALHDLLKPRGGGTWLNSPKSPPLGKSPGRLGKSFQQFQDYSNAASSGQARFSTGCPAADRLLQGVLQRSGFR